MTTVHPRSERKLNRLLGFELNFQGSAQEESKYEVGRKPKFLGLPTVWLLQCTVPRCYFTSPSSVLQSQR